MTVLEAVKILTKSGFKLEHQVGSHKKYRKDTKTIIIVSHGKKSERIHPRSLKEVKQVIL